MFDDRNVEESLDQVDIKVKVSDKPSAEKVAIVEVEPDTDG